jgi:hypothetical protein
MVLQLGTSLLQITCRFLDIFGKNIVSFEDTFSIRESVQIYYMYEFLV